LGLFSNGVAKCFGALGLVPDWPLADDLLKPFGINQFSESAGRVKDGPAALFTAVCRVPALFLG
jgi:hypothetical protein